MLLDTISIGAKVYNSAGDCLSKANVYYSSRAPIKKKKKKNTARGSGQWYRLKGNLMKKQHCVNIFASIEYK